jgi:hypothetical protein
MDGDCLDYPTHEDSLGRQFIASGAYQTDALAGSASIAGCAQAASGQIFLKFHLKRSNSLS